MPLQSDIIDFAHHVKLFKQFSKSLVVDDKFGVVKPTEDNNITLYVFPL